MRALFIVLIVALLTPAWGAAQDRQRVPPSSGGSTSSSGSSGGSTAVPRESAPPPPPPPPQAPPPPPATSSPRSSEPAQSGGVSEAQKRQRVPPQSRGNPPQPQPPRGTAVPRPPNQPPRPGGNHDGHGPAYGGPPHVYNNYYVYPRLYYPYGYGAFGLGYFYYDPYSWGAAYGYPAYAPFRGYGYGYPTGEIRLDVSPREAEVYVDGYYAGRVDDFDGAFQSLELEEGTYRIEIVSPGYGTLSFDVRIFPGRKITYRGELFRTTP